MTKNKLIILAVLLWLGGCLYGQSSKGWTYTYSRMPIPVSGCKAVAIDTLIYIIGGDPDSTNQELDIIQVYNPKRDSWLSQFPKLKSKRSQLIADKYQNGIIICGGLDSTERNTTIGIEFFDPKKNETTVISNDTSFNRARAAGGVINNSLYIFGGTSLTENKDYMVEYNLSSKDISFMTNTIFSGKFTYNQMSTVVKDDIYLFGGVISGLIRQQVFKYNVTSKKLEIASPLISTIRAGGEAVYDNLNTIYVIGGYNESQPPLSSVEKYYIGPTSGTSFTGPQLNTARKHFAAVLYNDTIYVFGGQDKYNHAIDAVEKLGVRITSTSNSEHETIAKSFSLSDNYPNPFNAGTVIKFSLPQSGFARLDVYSSVGEHVATLAKDELEAGSHAFKWNGNNDSGQSVGSGIYIFRLVSGGFSQSKKMVLLK